MNSHSCAKYCILFLKEGFPNCVCFSSIKPGWALAARTSGWVLGKERQGSGPLDVQENKFSNWEYFNLCGMILNATHSFVLVMILCILFPEVQSLYMYYSNFLSRDLKHTPHSISGIFLDENKL